MSPFLRHDREQIIKAELAILAKITDIIQQETKKAVDNAITAVLWSQYSLKKIKNPNPDLLDPYTKLPIVEPDVQYVDNYPIIFGNTQDQNLPSRSITFAFGSKAFLGYENDAEGNPYIDKDYLGFTTQNLGEIEVVNYRTLIKTLKEKSTIFDTKYLLKDRDKTAMGSVHTFGNVYFRGGEEKVYYGTSIPDPKCEIVVQYDLAQFKIKVQDEIDVKLNLFFNNLTSKVAQAIADMYSTTGLDITKKLNNYGDPVIDGSLRVNIRSLDKFGVIRNLEFEDAITSIYIKIATKLDNSGNPIIDGTLRVNNKTTDNFGVVRNLEFNEELAKKLNNSGNPSVDGTLRVSAKSTEDTGVVRNAELKDELAKKLNNSGNELLDGTLRIKNKSVDNLGAVRNLEFNEEIAKKLNNSGDELLDGTLRVKNKSLDNLSVVRNLELHEELTKKLDNSGDPLLDGTLRVKNKSTDSSGVVRNLELNEGLAKKLENSGDPILDGTLRVKNKSTDESGVVRNLEFNEAITTLASEVAKKLNNSGDTSIDGTLKVTNKSNDPNGIVRNCDIADLTSKHIEFNDPGSFTWNSGNAKLIEVIIVGGGGGCSESSGGGGGGSIKMKLNILQNTDYTIIVGSGGAPNADGGNSSFSGLIGFSNKNSVLTITADGGKTTGIGGGINGIGRNHTGAKLNENSDFKFDIGTLIGISDIVYGPGAGGGAYFAPGGSIGMYERPVNQSGGSSAFGSGSISNCSNNSPLSDKPGIGGGTGMNSTINAGNGIVIINTII